MLFCLNGKTPVECLPCAAGKTFPVSIKEICTNSVLIYGRSDPCPAYPKRLYCFAAYSIAHTRNFIAVAIRPPMPAMSAPSGSTIT